MFLNGPNIFLYKTSCLWEGGSDMYFYKKNLRLLGTALCIAVLTTFFGASAVLGSHGRIKIDKEVKKSFEAYKANSKYDYYVANSENIPCAVIGIRKGYEVGDVLWIKIVPGTDQFKKVIELVKRFPMGSGPAFGGYIVDSQGNTVGEYYSTAGAGVNVNNDTKSIMVTIFMAGKHH